MWVILPSTDKSRISIRLVLWKGTVWEDGPCFFLDSLPACYKDYQSTARWIANGLIPCYY